MISFAAALGKPKDLQERLGWWKGDSSEHYVRTSKIVVMAFQHEVADIIRKRDVDCLGDAEALQALEGLRPEEGCQWQRSREPAMVQGCQRCGRESLRRTRGPADRITRWLCYLCLQAERGQTASCGSSSTCKSYVCYDNDLPLPEDYDQVCRKSWKDGTATAIEDTALSSSSSSASSSTSDSG